MYARKMKKTKTKQKQIKESEKKRGKKMRGNLPIFNYLQMVGVTIVYNKRSCVTHAHRP